MVDLVLDIRFLIVAVTYLNFVMESFNFPTNYSICTHQFICGGVRQNS